MANENRAEFLVNLKSDVVDKARKIGASVRAMGAEGSRSMRVWQATVNQTNKVIDAFDNKLMGFAMGGGLAMSVKQVGNYKQMLTELASRYNLTKEQAKEFNQQIWNTAANRRVPYENLLTAVDSFLERTNDFDGLLEQLDNVALGVKGLGLESKNAGNLIGTLFLKGVKGGTDMRRTLDGLTSISTIGTGNFNEQLSALAGLTHDTNWTSPDQLMQLLAMQRVSSSEFGNSAQSAAAFKSMFDAIKNPQNQRLLKRNGVDVYSDPKNKTFKDPAELLFEIGNAAKFKERNLDDIFSGDMLKIAMLFADQNKQNDVTRFNSSNAITGILDEKAANNINTFNGAMQSLLTAGERFAELKLAQPIQDLADAINNLSPEELQRYANTIQNIAVGVGAIVGARYAYRGYKALDSLLGPAKKLPGAGGMENALGATPVYVTNWHEMNGGGSSIAQSLPGKNKTGRGNVLSALSIIEQLNSMLPENGDDFAAQVVARNKARHDELSQDPVYAENGRQRQFDVAPWFDNWLQSRVEAMDKAKNMDVETFRRELKAGKTPTEIKIQLAADGLKIKGTQIISDAKVSVNTGNNYQGDF